MHGCQSVRGLGPSSALCAPRMGMWSRDGDVEPGWGCGARMGVWHEGLNVPGILFSRLSRSSTALNSFYFPPASLPRPHITSPLAKQPREDPKFTFFKRALKSTISCALLTQRPRPGSQEDLGVGTAAHSCLRGLGCGIMRCSHFNKAGGRCQMPLPQLGRSEGVREH